MNLSLHSFLRLRAKVTRARIARSLVAVLVGTLFVPLGSTGITSLIDHASAAFPATYNCTGSGSVTVNNATTTTYNSCVGGVDLSGSGLTELNGTFFNKTNVTSIIFPSTLTTISGNALYNTGVSKLILPPSVISICSQCISNNAQLSSLEMSGSASATLALSGYALGGNPKLTYVSFGYSETTSVRVSTPFPTGQFLFQDDISLKTINYCGNSSSNLATFLTATMVGDGQNRRNIFSNNPAGLPTVSCGSDGNVTGGGTTQSGSAPNPIIYSFTGTRSGLSITLNSGTIQATSTNLNGKSFYISTDNYNFTEVCRTNDTAGNPEACTKTGLNPATTYYFKLKAYGTNGYDSIYTPNVVVTTPSAPTLASASISGSVLVGSQLTAVPGAISGSGITTTYQWQSSPTAGGVYTEIGSATASTYTPVIGDSTNFLKVVVTVTNSVGSDSKTATTGTAVAVPAQITCRDSSGAPQTIYAGAGGVVRSYSLASCTGAVTFGAGVTRLEPGVFVTAAQYINVNSPTYPDTYNTKVTKITFPATGFTTLDDRSLALLTSVGYVAIPNTVRTLVDNVFWRSYVQTLDMSAYQGDFTGVSFAGAVFNYAPLPEYIRDCSAGNTLPTSDAMITRWGGSSNRNPAVIFYCTPQTTKTFSGISLSSGTLQPTFSRTQNSYTATVPNSVTSITLTPTSDSASSSIHVNGILRRSGDNTYYSSQGSVPHTLNLAVGANVFSVVVTAQDQTSINTYTVTVTRSGLNQDTLTATSSLSTAVYNGTAYTAIPGLSSTGGSGSGRVSYTVSNGTATGCSLSSDAETATLSATSSGTCLLTANKAASGSYDPATSAAIAFTFTKAKLSPIFETSTATSTSDGFTLQIRNWDSAYTWTGTNSLQKTVTISPSGLITVSGVNPGTASTVAITTSRIGYDSATATSAAYASLNGSAKIPTFGASTSTSDGFTLQVTNYDTATTWSGINSLSKPVTISGTGLVTVTGIAPGTVSTVTIQTTRSGYDTGTATSAAISSINGTAKVPTFGAATPTSDGFTLQITNYDTATTWSGTNSLSKPVTISGTGFVTVTGVAPGTASTVIIQTTRSGYDTGTVTSPAIRSINGAAKTPTFGTATPTSDGFTLQISNYDTATTWSGTNSLQKTVTISATGLVTVTGVSPGTSSTVTITTTRSGYETGTATSSAYTSITGSARSPAFGAPTSIVDGFTLPITNFDSSFTWSGTNSLGKTVTINGTTGLITVTGVNPGTSSTVTVRTTRTGYDTGTATSSAIYSLTGAAKIPIFGSPTSTVDGFTLPITNYETTTSWSVTNSLGKSASINSLTGLITVTGVSAGTFSTVTVTTTRLGYETGTATSNSISSATAATQPTGVTATTATRSSVVSWTAPSDTGGIAITDYAVEYSSTNGETWTAFSHSPSILTSLTITGLLDGTAYLYRVAAINAAGQSPFSTSSSVKTSYYVVCTTGSFWVAGSVIPSAAGANCTGTATIPVGITGVAINSFAPGSGATQTNRALTAIVFPASGFVNIDQGGFRNLGLTSITIPASVTMVGLSAFENNPLTTVIITGASGGASTYLSQGAFNNQNVAFGLSTSIALTFGSGKIDIGFNFGYSTRFSTVDFGSGINSIDETAFKQNGVAQGWIPLFPSTITSIGKDAFNYNPNISTIRFGSGLTSSITSISDTAFDASAIKSVQYCGPTGTVLSNYLKNRLPAAKIWCNFVVPNAPTISSTSKTNQQVTIVWTKGASLDEAPTDTFTVQYKSGGGSWIPVAYDSTTPLSSTIRNLTNGTTYTFRVAANNIVGSSSYSSEVQVTPLGLALIPTFDTSVATANGFTFNVTNYDSRTAWSAAVTAGSGTVTVGAPNGALLPITVSSMNNGATVSVQVTTTRSTYETGTASTAGTSLNASLTPTFGTPTVTTNGFIAAITNYDSSYTWAISTSAGSATISNGSIVVSGVAFSTPVIETVTAVRSNFITGSANLSVITLAGLTATYYANRSSGGGLVPSDTASYSTNGTLVVLGNSGTLTNPGYTFTGWNLNSGNTGTTYTAGNTYTLANSGVAFYAQWTPTPFNVIYHATEAGAGEVPVEANTYTIGTNTNVRGNSGNLVRTGYVFAGWSDNANRTGRVYVSGDTYTVQTNNIDLWAAWTPNTYTVTFDTNGASGSPSKLSDSYTVGSSLVRLATIGTMSKSGYNFGGWATQASGTPISDSFTVASNTTLFAQWNVASFTLAYDLDGGTGTVPGPTAVNYLQRFDLAPATGFTKVAVVDSITVTYAFVAWRANSATFNPGQSYYMPASNITFTATWTRIYNVKYSYSGGSVANEIPEDQRIEGETIFITSTIPTRAGYEFAGWVDQSGETTSSGAVYTIRDGHYLLYAQWSATPYSVTYDAANGSPAPSETSKTIGQSFLVGAAPTKPGYDFMGWSDGANTYAAGAPYVTQSSNIIFTAQWQAQVYTVRYDLNGGVGSAGGNRSYTYGTAAYTLPTTGFSLTDYSFGGWATTLRGANVGATFAPSADISLYAIWNIAIYRLTFDASNGVSDSSTAKTTTGQFLILPGATRANYTLQGWSNQPSGGNLTAAGASYTPTSDTTLYAQWALQIFTVTYNGNGGTSDTSTANMTYGSATPLILPSASRSNYVFTGWYSAATGGYLIGNAGASFTPSSSVTIYAHWLQASLEGLGQATKIAEVTVIAGNNSSFTAGSQGSSATVSYTADSLPTGTVISAYVQSSTDRASALIDPNSNYILSMVVAWVAPDGTVPNTADGKPIVVTITNTGITKGSRVYGLIGTTPRYLGTATVDGSVQVSLTQDPTVTVAITRPDSATSITAVALDDTSALITWDAPEVTGGSPITDYTVTSNAGQTCTSALTTCTITGLSAAVNYTFTVVARNSIGSSDQSVPTAQITTFGTPAPPAPPAPPSNDVAAPVVVVTKAPAKDETPAPVTPVVPTPEVKPIPTEDPNQGIKSDADKAAENAQKLALEDAAKAAAEIVPAITVYSITKDLKLSDYNLAYLRAYLATLKPHAMVTCIGYTYSANSSLAEATALAKKQANALCAIIKQERSTLSTSILIRSSESAPIAAPGAQWVAVSYRVDGYEPITPTKRFQDIQTGLSFLAYQPTYTAALDLKKIEISQCATNKNYGMSAQYGSAKKSIAITEYGVTKSCSFAISLAKGAKQTIVTKKGTSMRPGARISLVTFGLTAIEVKKIVAGLVRVPIQ